MLKKVFTFETFEFGFASNGRESIRNRAPGAFDNTYVQWRRVHIEPRTTLWSSPHAFCNIFFGILLLGFRVLVPVRSPNTGERLSPGFGWRRSRFVFVAYLAFEYIRIALDDDLFPTLFVWFRFLKVSSI